MSEYSIPDQLLLQLPEDRKAIEQELSELTERDARMHEAASEQTLSGHLRQAIHRSRQPLSEIARHAGISTRILCDFLEGERTLRSDVLDRLTEAAGVTVSLARGAGH